MDPSIVNVLSELTSSFKLIVEKIFSSKVDDVNMNRRLKQSW